MAIGPPEGSFTERFTLWGVEIPGLRMRIWRQRHCGATLQLHSSIFLHALYALLAMLARKVTVLTLRLPKLVEDELQGKVRVASGGAKVRGRM